MDNSIRSSVVKNLFERVKELECLYSISQIAFRMRDDDFNETIQSIVGIVKKAWQYPKITSVKICIGENIYLSENFQKPLNKQRENIYLLQQEFGYIEVSYHKEAILSDEGPFLKEERSLLKSIAQQLSLILERVERNKEKALLERKLKHADRLATLGELTAGIAHELNEPLGTILGYAQLIEKEDIKQEIRSDISKIIDASMHARKVIRNLLAFSKYESNGEKKYCDLNSIISDGLYFLENRCRKENIIVAKILDPNIPELYLNQTQIHQVIVNLCVNAMQAMPKGGDLVLQTRLDNDYVKLLIQDNGIGISEDTLDHIFDPFFTTKEGTENSGLGLSVVHGIIKSHGGRIEVESLVNVGTTFKIILKINNEPK